MTNLTTQASTLLVEAVPATAAPGFDLLALALKLPSIMADPLEFLNRSATSYGKITRFGSKFFLIADPHLIEKVLVQTHRGFIKGINSQEKASKPRTILGNGLIVSEGNVWLRQRRLAQPAFHHQRLGEYGAKMVSYTEKMVEGWQDGQVRQLQADMTELTLEIVTATLLNIDISSQTANLKTLLNQIFNNPLGSLPLPTPQRRRYHKALAEFDNTLYALIKERRESGEDKGDLLSMFLAAQDEDEEGRGMSDEQVHDELINMIIAGHETTALALTWTFYLLSQNPSVEEKMLAEIQQVVGDKPVSYTDLARLPYSTAVLKEALRLYPVTWGLARKTTAEVELGGYNFKKGSWLILSPWVMHHSPAYFKAPNEMKPERWLAEEGSPQDQDLPKYAYFPFGGGPRVCIGQSFATLEAILGLVTILRHYHLELVPGQVVTPRLAATLRPKKGLRVRLVSRQ